ncbi:MAG: CsbD family protein [Thermoanaerobaculia bacterium]
MASGKEHEARGMITKLKGAVKEGFGALTGDRSTEAEGKIERAKGTVQEKYGRAKDHMTSNKNDPTKGL